VGTYSSIDPRVEQYVCEHLGLNADPLSTQVISRDHHAYLAGVLATTAATCERIATEIRNLQRTDTLEAEEPFRKGQKGSSAMPHKRNPITVEKVCGLSRVVKANAQVAFDNVALWHERDISHSSAERVAQADSFIALDHMFQCLIRIVDGLILYPKQMMANLNKTRGLIYSSKVLLALVDTGITREDAYKIVQDERYGYLARGAAVRAGHDLRGEAPGRSCLHALQGGARSHLRSLVLPRQDRLCLRPPREARVRIRSSMFHYDFRPRGVCSRAIHIDLADDGKTIENVSFEGGCNGNLKAIGRLVQGKSADEIAEVLAGNTCGPRPTSCADQLSKALKQAEAAAQQEA
jgi:uncharacterized protein (TIGR03905 family)